MQGIPGGLTPPPAPPIGNSCAAAHALPKCAVPPRGCPIHAADRGDRAAGLRQLLRIRPDPRRSPGPLRRLRMADQDSTPRTGEPSPPPPTGAEMVAEEALRAAQAAVDGLNSAAGPQALE